MNAARSLALMLALASLSSCPDDTVVYQDLYLSVTSDVPADGLSIDRLVLTFRSQDSGVLGLFGQSDSDILRYEVSLPTVADITDSAYVVQINAGELIRGDVLAVVWGLHASEDRPLVSWSGGLDLDSDGLVSVRLKAILPTCDVDGDGLLDCSVEGCCSSADTILEDCDDSNAASHPLAAIPACIPCEPQTDYDCDGQIDSCPDRDDDNAADCDAMVDCDPDDSSIHASAEEICDGKDNDCNGITDDKFTDTDADGTKDCVDDDIDGDGVANNMDCAPLDGATYPGATELCDGIDNDCNEATDDSPGCVEWEDDWDGDGILPGQDCNNYDSKIFPGSTYAGCCIPDPLLSPEALTLACDFDCDGNPNLCSDDDDDGDGYSNSVDCPGGEQDPAIYPGAPEKCGDGIDQDCLFGDQDCESIVDADGDQYGADVDCDDNDPTVHPNAPELCDGKDNDCDSFIDDGNPEASTDCLNPDPDRQFGLCALAENLGTTVCAQNTDNPALPMWASEQVNGEGHAVICVGFYPPPVGETFCDNQDEDCDGQVDEDFEWVEIHSASAGTDIVLAKGDTCGAGACLGGTVVCHPAALSRDVSGQLTCDSLSNQSNENSGGGPAVAFCDGIDNDCDGVVDGHSLPLAQTTCKQLGVCGAEPELVQTACVDGVWQCGYTMDAYDGETELRCDGLDNDCDGNVDEDLSWENVPFGAPCDGTGECGPGIVTCNGAQQAICSTNPTGPQAEAESEVCDEKDNDCDGLTDEGQYWEWNGIQYPLNSLCEGIGECGVGVVECSTSSLLPVCSTNSDGTAPESSSEVCDGKDNDCDGLTDDELFYEGQPMGALCDGVGECGAGIVECAVDGSLSATCSTNVNGASSSDAMELCDGLDNDCDGLTDDGFAWTDPISNTQIPLSSPCDGIGECNLGIVVCAPGDSTIAVCSTNTDGTQPQNETEVCDGLDNNCDGQTDDGLGWFDPELNAIVPLGSPCDGIGQCGTGVVECANDGSKVATCSTNPNGSDYVFQVEICNNLDDDCDGLTDDVTGTATPGVTCALTGACNPANVTATCIAGNWSCDYSIVVGFEASEQSCDGIDNDCDGLTDEAGLVVPTECDKPGVCLGASPQCNGASGWSCGFGVLPNYAPSEQGAAFCDGLDNDCDGSTDEHFPSLGQVCTSGQSGCAASGVTICTADATDTFCDTEGLPAGTPCNDGLLCTFGDMCSGGYDSTCNGTDYSCVSDGLDCTTDTCLGDGSCEYILQPDACLIDGVCRTPGSLNPLNDCLLCDPDNAEAWSDVVATTACDDGNACTTSDSCDGAGQCIGTGGIDCSDGLQCTQDSCVAVGVGFECENTLKTGACLIDGACYATGVQNPGNPCQICDASIQTAAWVDRTDGTACTDNNKCTLNDSCQSGVCAGITNPCDDSNPCTDDSCDPGATSLNGCVQTDNSATCTDDGLPCTQDKCDAGTCTHPLKNNRCLIGGTCYANDAVNPDNICETCDAASPLSWSSASQGQSCDDGLVCTSVTECDGSGTCEAITTVNCDDGNECTADSCSEPSGCVNAPLDGTQCQDDGLLCTADQCSQGSCEHIPTFGTCAIDGQCYLLGAGNPTNVCQRCTPAQSPLDWSPVGNGLTCDADSDGCTPDSCQGGLCVAGPTLDCTALDTECTLGVCISQSSFNGACSLENRPNGTACTDDGLVCTEDQCLEGVCDSSEVSSGCLIAGACVPENTASPTNSCLSCQNAVDPTAYVNSPIGTDCSDDTFGCTSDTCDGSGNCNESLNAGTCLIDSSCYAQGAVSPSGCSSCQPSISETTWTVLPNATACTDSDGLSCTYGQCNGADQCIPTLASGVCLIGGVCFSENAVSSTNPCQACQSGLSINTFTDVPDDTACPSDGNECTLDICKSGVCNTAAADGSLCGDGNDCLTNTCQTGFCDLSSLPDGSLCTDDGNVCTSDSCQAGACIHPVVANGTACPDDGDLCTNDQCESGVCQHPEKCEDDGLACTLESCDAGSCTTVLQSNSCLIDGLCTDDGTEDPGAACQYCVAAISNSSWTSWADESLSDSNCEDGIDNDCDGLTDVEDAQCNP